MSYTDVTHATLAVHYSGSISYPPSDTGGTRSYSGTVYENVEIRVHVNTEPFDHEVDNCRNRVDLLTGAVVATEGAQVASVRANSRRIGDTIIKGFFKTVRSEVSQQIAALQSNIDSLLIHLNELSNRCLSKTKQMETDYNRISSRYLKIFDELDTELENRVHAIDAPVFEVTRKADAAAKTGEDLMAASSVSSAENARLHARISAAMAKRSAVKALRKAERFLDVQYTADDLLANCLRPGGEAHLSYTPYMVMETVTGPGSSQQEVHTSPLLADIDRDRLANCLNHVPWQAFLNPNEAGAIGTYFNDEVGRMASQASSEHDRRVASMTARLFNLSQTVAPGY